MIKLSEKNIEVKKSYDVIVVGGGTAGALAAVRAAREGVKVLIIEQFGALGGSATVGLVTPLMSSHLANDRGHCALSDEITKRMQKLGGTEGDDYKFDPSMLMFVLEDMALTSGCDILYHTTPLEVIRDGDRITHIVVHNKDGITAYEGFCFIDASGDADLAVMAGVPYSVGDQNGVNQPVSLRFEMAGIDYKRFHSYMRMLGNESEKYFAMNTPGMKEVLTKAYDDGVLTKQDIAYFQAFGIPGREDAMNFNCPELTTKAGVADAQFITEKQIEGKKAILRLRSFLRGYIPGFENAYITQVAPFVGFRESRRIEALYVMTINDILTYRKFDDAVIKNRYPLDVHGVDDVTLGLKYDDTIPEAQRYWEVPFRTMVANNVDNLLVTGRCAGFDFRAQSAVRIQLICRAMGEAAGVAAAMAVKGKLAFKALDFPKIKEKMKK